MLAEAACVYKIRHTCCCFTTGKRPTFVEPVRDAVEYILVLAGSCYLHWFTRRRRLVVKIVLVHKSLGREEGKMQYIVFAINIRGRHIIN